MKKLFLAILFLLAFALPAQATNTYWTEARVRSCEQMYGTMPIGRTFCSLLYDQEEALLGTGSGQGLGVIGYEDSGSQTAAATGDAALDQIYGNINRITIGVLEFRECDADGDSANILIADHSGGTIVGGILATDTLPALIGYGTTATQAISWATTQVDSVCATVLLPPNFSGASNVTINLLAGKNDLGVDLPVFTVLTSWGALAAEPAANVTDTSAAITNSLNIQSLATTVAADDVPDAPITLSIHLTIGAHANDAINLYGVEIVYVSE